MAMMETLVVALRPQQHATITSDFSPTAYDILLTDVPLGNSDKSYGGTLKQLPKCNVNYDQEPGEALFSFLNALTGLENGGLKGKRAIFISPDKNDTFSESHSDSISMGTLYCVPIDYRDKLNPKVVENSPNMLGFYSLSKVMNALNTNAYMYSKQTRQMLYTLASWLREKHNTPGLISVLFSLPVEQRLKDTVTNPAYYTESIPRHLQRYCSTSDLYTTRSVANEALAKMLSIEKCEITIINPLFGKELPYNNKVETNVVNRFWGMGKPDYSKIALLFCHKNGVKSQSITEEDQQPEEELDSGNNSSGTKNNYSKSTSSKESFTISITDADTWAPLETAALNGKNLGGRSPAPSAAVVGGDAGTANTSLSSSEQLTSGSCTSKEQKDLTNLHESHSVSVENEMLTVTDIDSLIEIESGASSAGSPIWLEEFPLHKCAYEDDSKGIQDLLQQGYMVDSRDHDVWAPVHYAASYGHMKAIATLLDIGQCSPNVANDQGSTPLHLAAENGHQYVTELLLNHTDIDVNAVDKDNKTALSLCRDSEDPKTKACAKLLAAAAVKAAPELQVFLMDGTHRMLSLVSGANTTVQQIHQQMMMELDLPASCGHLFTLWICSRNLQLQLKPDHKPIQHLNDWRRKIVGLLTDEDPAREDPQLVWRRDVILNIEEESKVAVKHHQAINLLFHEAYHNYIKSLYTCADLDVILLGTILMQLNQGDYEPRKVQTFFANDHGLQTLVPVAKLRIRTIDWRSKIKSKYQQFSESLSNRDRSHPVLQQKFLTLCWNLLVYGSAFFTGQIQLKSTKNKNTVYIGVNDIGVHIVNGQNKVMLKSFKYDSIEWEIKEPQSKVLEIRQKGMSIISIFTRQAGLINHLMTKLAQINMARSRQSQS